GSGDPVRGVALAQFCSIQDLVALPAAFGRLTGAPDELGVAGTDDQQPGACEERATCLPLELPPQLVGPVGEGDVLVAFELQAAQHPGVPVGRALVVRRHEAVVTY